MKLQPNQAKALLERKIETLIHNCKSTQDPYGNDEAVREGILGQAYRAFARHTVHEYKGQSAGAAGSPSPKGWLALGTPAGLVMMLPYEQNGIKLVNVVAEWHGTEEFDGEDAGTKVFTMNASSLADLRTKLLETRKVDANTLLEMLG